MLLLDRARQRSTQVGLSIFERARRRVAPRWTTARAALVILHPRLSPHPLDQCRQHHLIRRLINHPFINALTFKLNPPAIEPIDHLDTRRGPGRTLRLEQSLPLPARDSLRLHLSPSCRPKPRRDLVLRITLRPFNLGETQPQLAHPDSPAAAQSWTAPSQRHLLYPQTQPAAPRYLPLRQARSPSAQAGAFDLSRNKARTAYPASSSARAAAPQPVLSRL